ADPLPCWDQYCSEDEFCGEIPGGTRCFCRALFSAKYEPTKALGDSTTCTANSATLTLAKCLLEDVNVDYNNLHLKDPNCKGVLDPKTHLVTFSFDDGSKQCGTDVEKVDNIVTYSNAVMDQDPDDDAIIIRHDQVRIDFSCTYRKPEIQSFPFRIASGSVTRTVESQDWSYTLTMSAYIDPDFKQLITDDTEIQLNQRVWVKLMTSGLDDTMVTVVTQSCWATSEDNNQALLKHFLISNGCPDDGDSTVQVEGNGVGTSNSFSFSMFQFTSGSGQIYLHCELELCLIGGDTPCAKSCGSLSKKRRRRRSSRSKYDRNPAVITMAWNR
ncbi:uromodulin-like, partial [Plectropomus leopardus]|uniref:uromodulin-like n=1 Tax=Plectropomus leopardus TaxID=160734 RepID=UPI001C4CE122